MVIIGLNGEPTSVTWEKNLYITPKEWDKWKLSTSYWKILLLEAVQWVHTVMATKSSWKEFQHYFKSLILFLKPAICQSEQPKLVPSPTEEHDFSP